MDHYGKRVKTRSGEIVSPWLSVAEAARYCGMSEKTFRKKLDRLPMPFGGFGGGEWCKRYHARVIDQWLLKLSEMGADV